MVPKTVLVLLRGSMHMVNVPVKSEARNNSVRVGPGAFALRLGAPLPCGAVTGIGQLREGPLHAALKTWLARPGDRLEVPVGGFVIDIVRADGELVEIQTGSFSPLRPKLDALLDDHRIRIVHPVPAARRVVRVDEDGVVLSSKASPKRPGAAAIFDGLVSFPTLLGHPHLTIDVLLCREDHIRAPAPYRGRRYLRDPGQRRLVEVLERIELATPADAGALVPAGLPAEFTTRELAKAMRVPLKLSQKAAACLRDLEVLEVVGKRGGAPLYHRKSTTALRGV
jgi:hypothetical protein